jgi:hypothetical protein
LDIFKIGSLNYLPGLAWNRDLEPLQKNNNTLLFCFVLFLAAQGFELKSLMLASQALYHLSLSASKVCFLWMLKMEPRVSH